MMSTIEQEIVEMLQNIQGHGATPLNHEVVSALLDLSIEEHHLDSLERMKFVMLIEERYGIDLDERDVIACQSLKEYAQLVQKHIDLGHGRG